jgi:hypothetical protein
LALLAGALRLACLDAPLTNAEAASALLALAALRGEPVVLPNPLLGNAQMATFALLGAGDAWARLLPALGGVALCLLPMAFRASLGRRPALLMGALLALSPTAWFVARQSGGAILAWALALAAQLAWRDNRPWPAAVAFGLLLATGSDAFAPAAISLLAALVAGASPAAMIRAWPAALLGFLLAATGLLLRPPGLGDAFYGFTRWFSPPPDALSPTRLILGLLISEPLILFGAPLSFVRRPTRDALAWLTWVIGGAISVSIGLGSDAAALLPVVVGAAGLAAGVYDALVSEMAMRPSWMWGIAVVMLAYAGLGVIQYAGQGRSEWLLTPPVAMTLLVALAASLGWASGDYRLPLANIASAGSALLMVYTLGAGWQMNLARSDHPGEAYRRDAVALGLAALRHDLRQISIRVTGEPDALAVQVVGEAPPALRWALRGQRSVTYSDQPTAAGLVLTPPARQPPAVGRFVGSSREIIVRAPLSELSCSPLPQGGFDCLGLARWLAFREVRNLQSERWVLWLRDDIARRGGGIR